MKRREFLQAAGSMLALGGVLPFARGATPSTPSKQLNLLFITVDDMNATMPGWMGNPLKPTPNLDAFAATSHRFVNNRDAAPICQPSREAMMTGLVPHHSGGLGFNPIHEGIPTLVTVLQQHGYWAAAIDKIPHMAPESCFPWEMKFNDSGKNPPMIANEMTQVLTAAKASGKPFFINCNICDPHRPFYGSGEAKEGGGKGKGKGKGDGEEGSGTHPLEGILSHPFTAADVTPPSFLPDLPAIREEYAQYCNSVQRLDISFGKVLDALQASGMADSTIVLFIADHGMPFPLAKATVYNNGPWCPFLVRFPGMGAPQVREELTSSIDLFPTLLELMNVPSPAVDGVSWLPLLKGQTQPNRDFVISHVNGLSSHKEFPQRVVQTKTSAFMISPWSNGTNRFHAESMQGLTYKAMEEAGKSDPTIQARVDQYILGHPMAFYDLVKDPDQRTNVIKDPQYSAEVARLQKILLDYMTRTNDPQLDNYKTLLAGGTVNLTP